MSPDIVEASREQASEIQQQLPGWMVLYGTYTKEFVAFPLFDAPPGTILTAAYPPALINRMRQAGNVCYAAGPAGNHRQP